MLALKAKPRTGKWFVKQKIGDELYRATGRWHRLRRLFDRRHDRYVEHIEDAETGELVKHVEEPLSSHVGHGDARNRED